MSASVAANEGGRRWPGGARHVGSPAAAPLILILLLVAVALADTPSHVIRLTAADAERAGTTIALVRHVVAGGLVLEVHPAPGDAAGTAISLLAVSPDGTVAALADRLGEPSGLLTMARADGSQLRVQLPGLVAASFAPDGERLIVIDGRGSLWQIDAESGDARSLADGPFLGPLRVAEDGSLLLLAVASVEAPYRSRLVRFVPSSGVATPVAPDQLVYAAFPLADGSLALVAHEPRRTIVRRTRIGDAASELLADLGADVVSVTVSADARTIAFEAGGAGIFVIDRPGARPRRLGDGSGPCLAADGSALLVSRGGKTIVLALDGSTLAELDAPARFVGSAGCSS